MNIYTTKLSLFIPWLVVKDKYILVRRYFYYFIALEGQMDSVLISTLLGAYGAVFSYIGTMTVCRKSIEMGGQ